MNINDGDFIAITGSGGKTHLMHMISMALTKNVWLTSTTKVSKESEENFSSCLVRCSYPEPIPSSPPARFSFFYLRETAEGRKLKGVCPQIIASALWKNGLNPVVCEADGSRNLPLKNYSLYDRPLSGFETKHIVSVSLSAIGEESSEKNIHRYSLKPFYGKIDKDMICDMLFSRNGYMDIPLSQTACLVIGGIDSYEKHETALYIKKIHKNIYPNGKCLLRGPLYGESEGWWHFCEE